jgi:tetratricopeptide (TPR) repeat protein
MQEGTLKTHFDKLRSFILNDDFPDLANLLKENQVKAVREELLNPDFISQCMQEDNWHGLETLWNTVEGPFTGAEYQAVLQKLSIKEDQRSEEIFWDIISFLVQSGRNDAASNGIKMVQTSIQPAEKKSFYLTKMATFALALKQYGNMNQAVHEVNEAWSIVKESTEIMESDRLDFLNIIASIYLALGYNNAAKDFLTTSLLGVESSYNSNQYCTCLCLLGITELNLGNLEVAEKYIQDSLNKRIALLGQLHPDTLSSRNALANVLFHEGKFDSSIQIIESIISVQLATLGENHEHTLSSYNNLGGYYLNKGLYKSARSYFLKTLKGIRVSFDKHHPLSIKVFINITNLLIVIGKSKSAKRVNAFLLRLSLQRDDRTMVIYNQAQCLLLENEPQKALPYARQAYNQRVKYYSKVHPDTLYNLLLIADIYDLIQQSNRAEALYRQGLRRSKLRCDEPDLIYLKFMTNLSVCLMDQERYDESLPFLRGSLKIKIHAYGYDHIETLISLQNMGHYFSSLSSSKAVRFLHLFQTIINYRTNKIYPFSNQLAKMIKSYT